MQESHIHNITLKPSRIIFYYFLLIIKMITEAQKNKHRLDRYKELAIKNISKIYDIDPIYIQ